MFLKVCGITRLSDALHAVEHGATALGFVFWAKSPRSVTPAQAAAIIGALPPHVTSVGIFVNESVDGICTIAAATGITAVQLHGDEPPDYAAALGWPVLRSATVDEAMVVSAGWPDATLLLDAADPVRRGGTGISVDWTRAAAIAATRRVILAGGLTPENVAEAIRVVRPFGVDVSSGVEDAPGVKNAGRVADFLAHARDALAVR